MKSSLIHHAKHHAIGKFVGFIAALWTSGMVSAFFEKKGSQNLWGLAGEKTTLSSETYHAVESSMSVIIGFIALLFVDYLVETKKHIASWEFVKKKTPVILSEFRAYIEKGKVAIKNRSRRKS